MSGRRVGRFHYEAGKQIELAMQVQNWPFYALIEAAMRRADTLNLELLKAAWPDVWEDLRERYDAPGGRLPGDPPWYGDVLLSPWYGDVLLSPEDEMTAEGRATARWTWACRICRARGGEVDQPAASARAMAHLRTHGDES